MGCIYLITNIINGKQYVGKTEKNDIQERWKEHCRDYKKERCEKRPLYNAMKKYGIENFLIQLIENVSCEDDLEEKEIYWIKQYNTYYNGYNATKGGDGKHYLNYEKIINLYKELHNCNQVANIVGCHEDSVRNILNYYKIPIDSSCQVNKKKQSIPVEMYDLNNNYIRTFESGHDAMKFVRPNSKSDGVVSKIRDVCKGKRKTAYGYIWHFANENR